MDSKSSPDDLTLVKPPMDGDLIDLQSFATRLGRLSWRRRGSTDALSAMRHHLQTHLNPHPEAQAPLIIRVRSAYVLVGVTTIDALFDLEAVIDPWQPGEFEAMARAIIHSGGVPPRQIDAPLVRAVLQPLARGERRVFRRSLAALDAALALLNVAGLDGRIPAITSRPIFLEMGGLQAILSGVLEESRDARGDAAGPTPPVGTR